MNLLSRNFVLGMLLLVAASCSSDNVANVVAAKNDANIKRVVNLYNAYQSTHGWLGPKDEKSLRDYVTDHNIPDQNLEMMGIDPKNLDGIFKSDRDGKPFKIRYGVMGGRGGVTDAIVFEDTGVGGQRLVAFNGPVVVAVDDARYKDLWEHGGTPNGVSNTAGRPAESHDAAAQKKQSSNNR
ncbi:MAG TPA: hypothetical protein VGJ04_06895 [Pirellulales bacterium]